MGPGGAAPSDPPAPAPPAQPEGARLDGLERRLARLAPGGGRAAAEELAEIEGGLLRACHADPARSVDGRDPLLAAAAACRALAAPLDPALEQEAARLVSSRAARLAEGYVGEVQAAPAEVAGGLAFTRLLDLSALERGLPAAATGPAARPLDGARAALRQACAQALAQRAPDPPERAAWVRELRDRAAAVRTGLDDVAPERAARLLGGVADDLAWHREQVERGPGRGAWTLARAVRRLRAVEQERDLDARLLARFGPPRVSAWERLVVGAILAVLALLVVEGLLDLPTWARLAFAAVDTLACGVLLTDFFVRLALVRGRGRWFLRHVWLDLLPSLPLSWLALAHAGGEPLHAGVGLRVLQLPRFARTLRFLLPALRLLRAVGFLARGLDRLARSYGRLLDHDVILHPTREERQAARARAEGAGERLQDLEGRVEQTWQALVGQAAREDRPALVALRVGALGSLQDLPAGLSRARPRGVSAVREITGEVLLERWSGATPAGVAARLEPELLTRLSAALRVLARAPLRWMPFVRRYLPRLGPGLSDAEVVAASARSAAAELARHHQRWLWFADLYGTLTPAEFVDRLGNALVRSSFRPAYRLTVFGIVYLVVALLVGLVGGAFLRGLLRTLNPFVTDTLVVLGGICFAILGLGWWMRRVASQSTAFYEALSGAQFLELLETLKGRTFVRDAAVFERRVLRAEAELRGEAGAERGAARAAELAERVRGWLVEPQRLHQGPGAFDAAGRVALLVRDALDGGLFVESDARTTRQFLGNPLLAALRRRSWRTTRAEGRALAWLDLDRPRSSLRGPYVWYSFLAQAVVQTVGRLLADYNRAVLPLSELPRASSEERGRHETWLTARHGEQAAGGRDEAPAADAVERASGEFIALHFLDDDPARDAEVAARYGPQVLAHLRVDRRFLVRRIFGSYPLHLRPRAERVLNLRRAYEAWFSRGRALLLPLRLLGRGLAFAALFVRWVLRALNEVRRPQRRASAEEAAQADFATALRKIDRARGPLADACLRLRARADVEYLGLPLPGAHGPGPGPAPVLDDLAFLRQRALLAAEIDAEREAARADLKRLERLLEGGLRARLFARLGLAPEAATPEHARALALGYRMDLDGVRSLLSAQELCREVLRAPARGALPARCPLWRWSRWRSFRAWWREHGTGDRALRRQAWRAAAHDVDGVGRALDVLARGRPDEDRALGEARAAELLRHPARATETLVTLRAVQTLALLDIRTYREHVYRLGRYADSGDPVGTTLDL